MNKESGSNSDYAPVLTGRDLPQTKDLLVRLAEFISKPWVYRPAAAFTTASILAGPAYAEVRTAEALGINCEFRDGFKLIYNQIPDIVGECTEDEHHDPQTGDALQATTEGLLAWRKADNWTAFTDGATTWINGPDGIRSRPNNERFSWEDQPQQEVEGLEEKPPLLFNTPMPSAAWDPYFYAYRTTEVGVTTERDLATSIDYIGQEAITGGRIRWDSRSLGGYPNYAVTAEGKVVFLTISTQGLPEQYRPLLSSYEELYGPAEQVISYDQPGDQSGDLYIYAGSGFTLKVNGGMVSRIDVYTPTTPEGYLANDLVDLVPPNFVSNQ